MTTTATTTLWALKGQGYEFCNCDFGCGCNFGGFPNSKDGSCRAFVGVAVDRGSCGGVDLSGVKCAVFPEWKTVSAKRSIWVFAGAFFLSAI